VSTGRGKHSTTDTMQHMAQSVLQSKLKQLRRASSHLSEWDDANPQKKQERQQQESTTFVSHEPPRSSPLILIVIGGASTASSAVAEGTDLDGRCPPVAVRPRGLASRADACAVYVLNNYNVSLTVNSYNGWDGSCLDYWGQYTVGGYGASTFNSCRVVFPCWDGLHCQAVTLADGNRLTNMIAIVSPFSVVIG
jgi:hypothetical protein